MVQRVVATGLWFLVGWTGASMGSYFLGLPDILAPILGLGFAAFVGLDPTGRRWSRQPRRSALLRRRLADLERVPDQAHEPGLRHEADVAKG